MLEHLGENQRERNRKAMLNLVEKIWITGFLEHVLHEMRSLNLDMSFADPAKVLQRPGMNGYTLPDSHTIAQAFYDLNRRMVILGEPGSGKTVTLLQLARQLIADARKDAKKPIPIVIALSSWAVEQLPFEEWLCKEIREKYGLSRRAANDLVKGERLAYLLDGLDEVAEPHREGCLKAIKEFNEKRQADYVLCSRKVEYENLTARLNVKGEIVINSLTPKQIDEYLRGEIFGGLHQFKAKNSVIQDFAKIPFMLNTMAVVTRGKSEASILSEIDSYLSSHDIPSSSTFLEDAALLRDYFLESYMSLRLRGHDQKKYLDAFKTRIYLKWLAGQLIKHDQTDLYIEFMQPDWLDSNQSRRRFIVAIIMPIILIIGIIGIVGGEIIALLVGILGLLSLEPRSKIKPVNSLNWSTKGAIGFGSAGIVLGILLALIYDIPYGIIFRLVVGLLVGLVIAIFFGIMGGLLNGAPSYTIAPLSISPNSGINRSLKNWFLGVFLISFFPTVFYTFRHEQFAIIILPSVNLFIGLSLGGNAVIKHIILRFYLWREGHIPLWRYDKFLDYAANDLIILRKVGGGYRFVHDYLRQYLASAAFVPDPMQKKE